MERKPSFCPFPVASALNPRPKDLHYVKSRESGRERMILVICQDLGGHPLCWMTGKYRIVVANMAGTVSPEPGISLKVEGAWRYVCVQGPRALSKAVTRCRTSGSIGGEESIRKERQMNEAIRSQRGCKEPECPRLVDQLFLGDGVWREHGSPQCPREEGD